MAETVYLVNTYAVSKGLKMIPWICEDFKLSPKETSILLTASCCESTLSINNLTQDDKAYSMVEKRLEKMFGKKMLKKNPTYDCNLTADFELSLENSEDFQSDSNYRYIN